MDKPVPNQEMYAYICWSERIIARHIWER